MKEIFERHFRRKLPSLIAAIVVVAVALLLPKFFGDEPDNFITHDTGSDAVDVGDTNANTSTDTESDGTFVFEDMPYLDKDSVAAYIHTFGKLPKNYLTKSEAEDLGWDSSKGNLWVVAPGSAIGGDTFRNYDRTLPHAPGRVYYECDVNYDGGYRDAERIVFSNDGLIFYTSDHYETFTELYAEDGK